MNKKFSFVFAIAILVLVMCISAFGQETTGAIEVTAKDANGAVIPSVAITVASAGTSTGFRRTTATNDEGYVRILQVPPGVYSVTAAATAGFKDRTVANVGVSLGKVTQINIEMVTTVSAEVTVSGDAIQPIDTTDSKIQTTISAQAAELLPKGANFASVLKISPATRPEPRSGQFQIDGASGSENTFIIDGQEVTNVRTGILDGNSNLPFQIVQEVQVKSSGFEAEYGGATGGVVNIVTKGGSNDLHGEFGMSFRPSKIQPVARRALILNSLAQAEYVPSRRDSFLGTFPTGNLSGPIIKDRLWFFASYTPQLFDRTRTIQYLTTTPPRTPTGQVETYNYHSVAEYADLRIDSQPFDRLRLTGKYIYNPIYDRGGIPSWASAFSTVPTGNGLTGAAYEDTLGGRQNSQSVTGQATWFLTNSITINGRTGHYFLNEKLGSYGVGDVLSPRVTCSASSPTQFPAGFGCLRGFNNGLPVNSNILFDATTRNTLDFDGTILASFAGRHEFKGGYQYNGVGNKLLTQTRDQIVFRYGQTIGSYSQTGIPSAPGAVGAGLLRQFRESGDVSSKNEGLFIQDKWQPMRRLTLNLGFRVEREDVPSFTPGLDGIKFNFSDKIAPRLGMAIDLTGDGKTKVSAFYGWFYDRFKYELPRGSFGGNFFHDFFYEIFPTDTLASFSSTSIIGSGTAIVGGSCPPTTTPIYGRVRCDIDYRVPSNSGLGIEFGTIDADIKAFRATEFTVTFEREVSRNYLFASRYTRKKVDHTIEDAGFPLPSGSEAYIIGNPGEGLYKRLAEQNGLLALKPKRQYDALEFRFDRRFANDYYFNANYTWSRLVGNYSGLASSDEDGRLSPNVNRFFDQPQAGWTVAGGPDNGVLPTDRPHVVKFVGAYSLDWNKRFGFMNNNRTEFQLFTTVQSGTPLTSTLAINNVDFIVLSKRGDLGRTEMFTETDFAIRHRYTFGESRFTLVMEADVLNLFNESNELNRENGITINGFDAADPVNGLITAAERAPCDAPPFNEAPCLLLAYGRFQRNGSPAMATAAALPANRYTLYNLANSFQGPRSIRLGFRLLF